MFIVILSIDIKVLCIFKKVSLVPNVKFQFALFLLFLSLWNLKVQLCSYNFCTKIIFLITIKKFMFQVYVVNIFVYKLKHDRLQQVCGAGETRWVCSHKTRQTWTKECNFSTGKSVNTVHRTSQSCVLVPISVCTCRFMVSCISLEQTCLKDVSCRLNKTKPQ